MELVRKISGTLWRVELFEKLDERRRVLKISPPSHLRKPRELSRGSASAPPLTAYSTKTMKACRSMDASTDRRAVETVSRDLKLFEIRVAREPGRPRSTKKEIDAAEQHEVHADGDVEGVREDLQ